MRDIRDLREDDIQIEEGLIVIPNNLVFEEVKKVKQRILTNQEDANEMRKIQSAGFFSVKEIDELANRDVGLRAMLKRLDERIEELTRLWNQKINRRTAWGEGVPDPNVDPLRRSIQELEKIREDTK